MFAVLFTPPAARAQAPVNNATLQLENLWLVFKRGALEGMLRASLLVDRLFAMRTPFALGITADEKLLEGLDKLDKKLGEVSDIKKTVDETKTSIGEQKKSLDKLTTDLSDLQQKYTDLQRTTIEARTLELPRVRQPGRVSDACAKWFASQFILHCEKSGKLEALAETSERREKLLTVARQSLGIQQKAALTTAEIPLPTEYGGELKELISEFGVARKKMMPFPIGRGTARPPRMGARPAFGSIAMSAAIPDKAPAIGFASLESHKIGGLVRLPREIDEQSIVPMGQFLARYGAVEFARAEDTWAFLADGSGTYENVKGIVQVARDNNKTVVLAAGELAPSDVTLADLRALRTKVNKAALSGRVSAYYLDSTWETRLPTFKTEADPFVYVRNADGTATLDGYPIVWTDVLTPYSENDAADTPLAVFGALEYWWFGEHGSPRIDTSEHVLFVNDQLAVRFIEEIDFDYAAVDATAALISAAA